MFYMANRCGAWQVGSSQTSGEIEFRVFFPAGFDPKITAIRVAGTFQTPAWNFTSGPSLARRVTPQGTFWEASTPAAVPAGYYQYKYLVTFDDGTTRHVSDPCARYSGLGHQNAAVVVGGSQPASNTVSPIDGGRNPVADLVIYEMMIDDFTAGYRGKRAPLDAVCDKLDQLVDLGFNAILFMPWTAWKHPDFDWGYEPFQYFALESRYANDLDQPSEKLSWLKALVNACHARKIHVIMDGVYNHVSRDFPYRSFYKDPEDCPYTGEFGGGFPGLQDLDFDHACTREFIRDVCFYWMDVFGIDGIRFDNTVNFYVAGDPHGLPQLLSEIAAYVASKGESNFSLTLEHLRLDAVGLTISTAASSYWDNGLYEKCFEGLWHDRLPAGLLGALNNNRWLNAPGKRPTAYLCNHDHSHVAWQAGARENVGSMRWWEVQPYVIGLYTSTAVPMTRNGVEFGEEHHIPEDDNNTGRRVIPRPLRWKLYDDPIGRALRWLYGRMGSIRRDYPGLRSPNIYPSNWEEWQTRFNEQGLGLDTEQMLVVYHRWGNDANGALQRFVVALNFSDQERWPEVPFPADGVWTDLLSGADPLETISVQGGRAHVRVPSHWGRVMYL